MRFSAPKNIFVLIVAVVVPFVPKTENFFAFSANCSLLIEWHLVIFLDFCLLHRSSIPLLHNECLNVDVDCKQFHAHPKMKQMKNIFRIIVIFKTHS